GDTVARSYAAVSARSGCEACEAPDRSLCPPGLLSSRQHWLRPQDILIRGDARRSGLKAIPRRLQRFVQCSLQRGRWRCRHVAEAVSLQRTYRREKAVAASGDRFDEPGIVGLVAESGPELLDRRVQTKLRIDQRMRPQSCSCNSSRATSSPGRARSFARTLKG